MILILIIFCFHAQATEDLHTLSLQIKNLQLSLSILQLNLATRTYKPFIRELNLVQHLGKNVSQLRIPLDNISPHATTGVATIAQLRDSFGIILLPKLYALVKEENASWINEMWKWFVATLIPWRNESLNINFNEDVIKSAMERLSEDDLQGAIDLIIRLDGPGAALVMRWLKEAAARLTIDAAMEVMMNTEMTLLK